MVALQARSKVMTTITRDPEVMSGDPVVAGTRVPAETVVAYLRAGHSHETIFEDFPTLPVDGIDAVEIWAEVEFGPDWRSSPTGPSSSSSP